MELMEQRKAIVHVLKREIISSNSSSFIDLSSGSCSLCFNLIQGREDTALRAPAGCVVDDIYRLLLHVLSPFSSREEIGS